MIRAEQALHPRLRQNRAQELGGDIALQQAIAVLAKTSSGPTPRSSTPMPTNQRNRRSNSSRSINCRSERIE